MCKAEISIVIRTHEEHVAQEGHYVWAFAGALSDDRNDCFIVTVKHQAFSTQRGGPCGECDRDGVQLFEGNRKAYRDLACVKRTTEPGTIKVIPFNCITHPFCASFLA